MRIERVGNLIKTYVSGMNRCYSTLGGEYKSLLYKEHGEPSDVLKLTDIQIRRPNENEVLVKWLLAPVNPADINTIQGKYPSKPVLPAVPGNEGVGEVTEIGPKVQNLSVGDKVIPNGNNIGTWTTHTTCPSERLIKVSKTLGNIEACMLTVNPCTAYRMLKDFVDLKAGDSVIQNGGNSAVGQFVIQLCRAWGLKSVNVVRDRPNLEKLVNELTKLGADKVLTEEQIRTFDLFKKKELPSPLLALNCVGGKSGVELVRHLGTGGSMVTYGGMSREPVSVPTSALIFKDAILRGFWMTAWTKKHENSQERWDMLDHLGKMFEAGELRAPAHTLVPLTDYREAITKTLQLDGKTGTKYILDMSR